jgi:hypothetical protein
MTIGDEQVDRFRFMEENEKNQPSLEDLLRPETDEEEADALSLADFDDDQ